MPKEEKNLGELSLPTPTFSTNAEIQTLLKRVSRHHWMVSCTGMQTMGS